MRRATPSTMPADSGRAAKLALEAGRPDDAKLRDLYRVAYGRDPQPDELQLALGYLAKKNAAAKEGKDAKETANRTVRNFYLSLLHAVGDKRESFGELDSRMPAAAQAGPLAEILA